jgi:hypothetical protein
VHDGFSSLLAEGVLKVCSIVLGEVITGNRLATILVHTLEDLVTGGVSQPREERNEFSSEGSGGLVLEDNLVQLAGAGYTSLVAHQPLRNGVDRMEDGQLSNTSGTGAEDTSQAGLLLATSSDGRRHLDEIE